MRVLEKHRAFGGAARRLAWILLSLVALVPGMAGAQTVSGSASTPAVCIADSGLTLPVTLSVSWEVPASVAPGESFDVVITSAPSPGIFISVPPPIEFQGPRFSLTNTDPPGFAVNFVTDALPHSETFVATGAAGDEISLEYMDWAVANLVFLPPITWFCPAGLPLASIPIVAAPTPTPTLMPTATPTPTPPTKKVKKAKVKKVKTKKVKKTKKQKK